MKLRAGSRSPRTAIQRSVIRGIAGLLADPLRSPVIRAAVARAHVAVGARFVLVAADVSRLARAAEGIADTWGSTAARGGRASY